MILRKVFVLLHSVRVNKKPDNSIQFIFEREILK